MNDYYKITVNGVGQVILATNPDDNINDKTYEWDAYSEEVKKMYLALYPSITSWIINFNSFFTHQNVKYAYHEQELKIISSVFNELSWKNKVKGIINELE